MLVLLTALLVLAADQATKAAVRQYLIEKGYDSNLMQVRAMGEDHPFATNRTPEGRANNRRVEVKLGGKMKEEIKEEKQEIKQEIKQEMKEEE